MDLQAFAARAGCIEVAQRCLQFSKLLTRKQLAHTTPEHDSIGSHLRHCLDFFLCFLRGFEKGEVCYDDRDRDARLEANPEAFRAALEVVIENLGRVDKSRSNQVFNLCFVAKSEGLTSRCQSTVERELVFLAGHGIHHLAIARLLAESLGVQVSEDLDTAFSTAVHRRRLATQG